MSAGQLDAVKLERKRALRRAGLAVAAALLLLIGVLVVEQEPGTERKPVAGLAVEAPVRAESPPPPATVADDAGRAGAGIATSSAAAVAQTEPTAPAAAPAEAAPPDVAPNSVPADGTVTGAASMPTPAAVAAQPAPAPAPPDGYLVQLGVFGALENAEALRADLAARGLPVRVEGRVVVGPFAEKAAAEAARVRLRRETGAVGFVVPPRTARAAGRSGK